MDEKKNMKIYDRVAIIPALEYSDFKIELAKELKEIRDENYSSSIKDIKYQMSSLYDSDLDAYKVLYSALINFYDKQTNIRRTKN